MAHNNGRIYIDTSTTPNKGVEIADLQRVLGRGTGDLGLLCSDQEWYLLPYQRIEYLESTGTQYIDTAININDSNFEVEAKLAGTEIQTSSQTILGTHDGSDTYGVALAFGNGGKIYIQLGGGSSYVTSSATPLDVHIYNASLKNGVLSISADGGSASTKTKTGTVATSSSMYMFARHRYDSTIGQYAKAKIYYLKIWNDGVLVRDFYPVRVGDVGYMYDLVSGQLFGNSGSGSFVLGEDIDSHILRPVNRINKWAKYKPVRQSGLDFGSQRNPDFTWKSTANWWKAHNGQCGMAFATFSQLYVSNDPFNANSFLRKLKDGELQWTYEAPTGGINQYPFRMFDFLQYDHNAPKPVSGVYDNLQLFDNGKLTVQLDESRAGESLGIQLSDLVINNASTDDWYVGMLIYKNDNLFQFAFSTQTIGNGGNSVEFTGMTNFAGQVTIVPFLSSVRNNQGQDPGAGTFLSCDVAPQTVTIKSEQQNTVTMTIDAQWKYALPGPVSYDVRIINNSGATISVAEMVIALYDGDPDNGGVRVEHKPTIETFNMSNGTVHDESGTFTNQNYDPTKTYYVVVSSSRSEVNGKKDVEQFRG